MSFKEICLYDKSKHIHFIELKISSIIFYLFFCIIQDYKVNNTIMEVRNMKKDLRNNNSKNQKNQQNQNNNNSKNSNNNNNNNNNNQNCGR